MEILAEISSHLTSVPFVVITLLLGGGGAYMSGRSLALSWRPVATIVLAALPLSLAVRFFHFALADEPLLAPAYWALDFAVVLAVAALGWKRTYALQMVRQYPWLYEPAGPLGWRDRPASPADTAVDGGHNA